MGLVPINGLELSIIVEQGNSLPMTARNSIISQFMQMDSDYIFWIDDDVIFTVEDFVKILDSVVEKKSVAGAYCAKLDEPTFYIRPIDGKNQTYTEDGFMETKGLGMGFSCQAKEILKPLVDSAEIYEDRLGNKVLSIFRTKVEHGQFVGEDYLFFEELYQLGHITYVDPSIKLKHVGRKMYSHPLSNTKEK